MPYYLSTVINIEFGCISIGWLDLIAGKDIELISSSPAIQAEISTLFKKVLPAVPPPKNIGWAANANLNVGFLFVSAFIYHKAGSIVVLDTNGVALKSNLTLNWSPA